jgi:uncharacterized protein involved in exopolysaccharide biosynthesis
MENGKNRTDRKKGFRSHLKFVLAFYILGFGIVYFIYLLSPKYYRASASILQPPERELHVSGSASDSQGKSLSQLRTNTELFFSILGSRTIKDEIIENFGLIKAYNARNIDHAREKLDRCVTLSLTKEKIIEITVIDTSPERSAEIANYFVSRLDNTVKVLSITTAKQDRLFIETRLNETENTINTLEKRLAGIKDRDKLVADKDLAQITETAGRLMEDLFNKKLELKRKGEILKADSFEMELLKKEIENTEATLSKLLYSENELMGIIRELRAQEEIYSFLTSKLEEAKIDEARDTPVIQELDKAVVPHKVYKPDIKLLLIIQAAVFGGLAILIFFFDLLRYLGNI